MICFQISTFVGSSTGSESFETQEHGLWFAFKLVPLLGHQQEGPKAEETGTSCDLLSN